VTTYVYIDLSMAMKVLTASGFESVKDEISAPKL